MRWTLPSRRYSAEIAQRAAQIGFHVQQLTLKQLAAGRHGSVSSTVPCVRETQAVGQRVVPFVTMNAAIADGYPRRTAFVLRGVARDDLYPRASPH